MSCDRSSHLVLALLVVVALPLAAAAQQTVAADRFVDAAGVNIHLHYNRTVYWDDFPLVRSRLIELGVRHVRDGLIDTTWQPYYERHNALGQAGIKGTFITAPDQSSELWASYPARMRSTFEAYEAPNEYDKSGAPNWAGTLTQTLKRLRSLRSDPRAAPFPLYGPSLTTEAAYAALGNVSALFDFANMHNYFGGRHPGTPGWGANGYGSIGWNLDLVGRYSGGKPVVTTETGYQDTSSAVDAIPAWVIGRYMPRVLLEQFRAGVVRTFLYELADFPNSGGYGLLDQRGSPKPAFTAVSSLLTLLADPGPSFTPQDLEYTVEGGGRDVRHMAFQKRNGTYFLALWRSVPNWDPASGQLVVNTPQRAIVRFPTSMRVARTYRWRQPDGSMTTTPASVSTQSVPVNVSGALLIIELLR